MTIRVVHIVQPTFGYSFSGITHRLYSLLSGWSDKEISLDIYGSSIKPLNIASGNVEYSLPEGILWSSNVVQNRSKRIQWSFDLLLLLLKRLNDYDVVQFHFINWGMLLSPLLLHPLRKKVIYSMSLYGNDNPGHIRNKPHGRLQLTLLQQFDGAIGISPALVKDAKENGIKNVACIPNFMAFPQFQQFKNANERITVRLKSRKKLGLPENAQILLFVGSIIYRKGVDILIGVFCKLAPIYPKLHLVLIGPQGKTDTTRIDETFVNELKEKIHSANLDDRVHWVGLVKEQNTLVDYYHAADIFFLPTRNEGLGNVLIEAMAAGLPVVTSLLPGITDEVVSNTKNGYLVQIENTDGFASALQDLLEDESVRKEMSVIGQEIAFGKFGFAPYCQALKVFYLSIYNEHEND